MVSSRTNVTRVLDHLGLSEWVEITRVDPDKVWGWPIGPALEQYIAENKWFHDPRLAVKHYHAEGAQAYREPNGPIPALHVIFFPGPLGYRFVEIHLDKCAPVDVVGAMGHLIEVVHDTVSGEVTDQDDIAHLLDRRFARVNG